MSDFITSSQCSRQADAGRGTCPTTSRWMSACEIKAKDVGRTRSQVAATSRTANGKYLRIREVTLGPRQKLSIVTLRTTPPSPQAPFLFLRRLPDWDKSHSE